MDHYLDLGGAGPTMLLAPANGFPPEAYQPLAAALAPQIRTVGYRPRPLWPGSDPVSVSSWRDLTTDMLADMEQRDDGPFIGAGHSLGGIMTLYAALLRPDLFYGLALIDPVLMPRHMLPFLWAMRQIGQHHRSPIAQGAARRRDRFASADEARARYTGRGVFADLDAAALNGYLAGGLRPDADGLTLAWPKAWEAQIFSLVPIDTWDALRRLRMPLLIIRGSRSDLLTDRSWRQLQRRMPNAHLVELDGGHMVPLERPAAVAEGIADWAVGLRRR
ncbi:alpha/beta hydrolase [Chloroflexales bacterium ZM16-3]|nr:alpha/beta hydrolase [Chloroflexales bacterium ZM16-3]